MQLRIPVSLEGDIGAPALLASRSSALRKYAKLVMTLFEGTEINEM